ncbi:MAG: hypothetical protein QNJ75_09770 [Acidimicrobiia bacterium]|nr:hypothetical protein [Acidimicrobiia bacterium]
MQLEADGISRGLTITQSFGKRNSMLIQRNLKFDCIEIAESLDSGPEEWRSLCCDSSLKFDCIELQGDFITP